MGLDYGTYGGNMMQKIKLIDFLEFVNFREMEDNERYSTKIVRIYYDDESDNRGHYKDDRFFEFGIYDFGYDTRKRIIDTLNSKILNQYVYEVGISNEVEVENVLKIFVSGEENIDDINCDYIDYPLEGYSKVQSELHMKKIFVSSPLVGDYENNIKRARQYCRFVINQGYMPLAPHVYYTSFLKDDDSAERQLGMDMGLKWLAECDELWVFNKYGISKGMEVEIDMATRNNIPIRYFNEENEDLKEKIRSLVNE